MSSSRWLRDSMKQVFDHSFPHLFPVVLCDYSAWLSYLCSSNHLELTARSSVLSRANKAGLNIRPSVCASTKSFSKLNEIWYVCTVWVKKNPPTVFWNFFPNGWEFLINFLHTYCTIISTLDCKFLFKYLQLWQSYAIQSATTLRIFTFH